MWLLAKILVIDDEDIVCRSCQRILSADGHDVSTACSGDEAMGKIENDHFDVALVDLKIPGSGGLSILRAIRKSSPQTTVVVITGHPSIENAKEAIRLGAFEFVTKPFVPQTLRRVVSQVLTCKPWTMQERC